VLIGKIVGAHGIKGTSKIQSYAESLDIFEPGEALVVKSPDGRKASYKINWITPHSRGALLAFEKITDREQAIALVGAELYIEKTKLPKLENGTYYWFELIGLNVYTSDDRFIGQLDSIIETGANDVYVVKKDAGEILIPALESVVQSIDTDRKIMRVELPAGLEDL
jgi:16S rRNA processing protein RimM